MQQDAASLAKPVANARFSKDLSSIDTFFGSLFGTSNGETFLNATCTEPVLEKVVTESAIPLSDKSLKSTSCKVAPES